MRQLKFVLFAHPRSGSSNLYEALQLHPDLDILEEPFNEGFNRWRPDEPNYLSLVKDEVSLDEQLASIFSRYNGIKALNYQLPQTLYRRMLVHSATHVIFLRRRNLLRSEVSGQLAKYSGLWKKWEQQKAFDELYKGLPSLPVDVLHQRVRDLREQLDRYQEMIASRDPASVINLVYEDFYYSSAQYRRDTFARILKFLGVAPFWDDKVSFFLEPETGRINSDDTYRYIPNAREIDLACGCADTGWLFERNSDTLPPSDRK